MNTVVIKEVRVIYIAMEFHVVQFTNMETQRDISSLLILDEKCCRIVLTALSLCIDLCPDMYYRINFLLSLPF